LADRLIQICGGLSEREMESQVLDSMDLEKERGITIKAHSVTLHNNKDKPEVKKLIEFLQHCQNTIFDGKAESFYNALEEDFELKQKQQKKRGR